MVQGQAMSERVHRVRLRAEVAEKEVSPRSMHFARPWMSLRISFNTRDEANIWLGKMEETCEVQNAEIYDVNEEL